MFRGLNLDRPEWNTNENTHKHTHLAAWQWVIKQRSKNYNHAPLCYTVIWVDHCMHVYSHTFILQHKSCWWICLPTLSTHGCSNLNQPHKITSKFTTFLSQNAKQIKHEAIYTHNSAPDDKIKTSTTNITSTNQLTNRLFWKLTSCWSPSISILAQRTKQKGNLFMNGPLLFF